MKCTFGCGVVVLVAAVCATPSAAQDASDEWDVVIAPYLMGASMSGATTVRGLEVDVDVSAGDIFDNLQFGAMGMMAARKGNWGFGADLIWMALGTTVQETNVDFNQGAFAFYGLRRLGAGADLTFGLRVNTLQGELDFKRVNRVVEQDKTWVDPIVGLLLRTPGEGRFGVRLYTEVGGFGAGSDFTWQAFPVLQFRLTKAAAMELGYRWMDTDYASGEGNEEFRYDVLSQGPVAGFSFRF
jgi:hypothetical protein